MPARASASGGARRDQPASAVILFSQIPAAHTTCTIHLTTTMKIKVNASHARRRFPARADDGEPKPRKEELQYGNTKKYRAFLPAPAPSPPSPRCSYTPESSLRREAPRPTSHSLHFFLDSARSCARPHNHFRPFRPGWSSHAEQHFSYQHQRQ